VEGGCSLVGWAEPEEEKGASGLEAVGTGGVAGNSWSHSQTVRVSPAVVGIAGNPGVEVGSDEDEIVGESKAVSAELEEAVVVAGIAERVGVQGREERKAGADSWMAAGIGSTVAWGDGGEAVVLVVGVGAGRTVGDAGVAAAAASRVGYHHNRSSHTERTARREDAVAGLAEEGSIASCKFRN